MMILEFNELTPRLLSTTEDEHLEPWVQWITFHCGVAGKVHGVRELDQCHTVTQPAPWDVAAQRQVLRGAMCAVVASLLSPPRALRKLRSGWPVRHPFVSPAAQRRNS